MKSADTQNTPVKAKAVLIDPGSTTVLWMNEAALQDFAGTDGDSVSGVPIDQAVPLAETLGVPEALSTVARTGVAQHMRTDLVSTSKGSMAIATSVYRLPDGKLLLLMEHAWHVGHEKPGGSAPRSGRQRR